jgi:hypothetical protein
MSKTITYLSSFSTIREINEMNKPYKIHFIGKFDKKGIVKSSSTRYGETVKVDGILYDDTGEIKVKLWGDIAKKIHEGDLLELDNAYSKNGILSNKQGGMEVIHEI